MLTSREAACAGHAACVARLKLVASSSRLQGSAFLLSQQKSMALWLKAASRRGCPCLNVCSPHSRHYFGSARHPNLEDVKSLEALPVGQLRQGSSRRSGPICAAATTTAARQYSTAGLGSTGPPRICILGGGFGGLYAAVRLEGLMWPRGTKPQVTLVDKSDRFVFKPLLYELINGAARTEEVAPLYTQLLNSSTTRFVQGTVEAVEADNRTQDGGSAGGGRIRLQGGSVLEYDWLVLAVGSQTNTFGIEGVKEHAVTFWSLDDVAQINARLADLDRQSRPSQIMVVGAGLAGVELASTLAERLPHGSVQIVDTGSEIMPGSPAGQRAAAQAALAKRGVLVVHNSMVKSIALEAGPASGVAASLGRRRVTVEGPMKQKQELLADLVCWTAGSMPSSRAGQNPMLLPFPCNDRGATQTETTLRVASHARVFALGDVSTMDPSGSTPSPQLPPTAQVAFQQADYVAWNLWASINQRPLLPFKYQHLGDMMSLGRDDGAVALPIPVPEQISSALQGSVFGSLLSSAGIKIGAGVTLEGQLAGLLRRAAYWYRQPTDRHRIGVGQAWLQRTASDQRRTTTF